MFSMGGPCHADLRPLQDPSTMPVILRYGKRHTELIPLEGWKELASRCPHLFGCNDCAEEAVGFLSPGETNYPTMSCRCTTVMFLATPPFDRAEQWSDWQADYEREKKDPAPIAALIQGQLVGKPEGPGADWLSRRAGFPAGLQWSLDGTISVGNASLSVGPGGLVQMVDHENPSNNVHLLQVTEKVCAEAHGPPARIVFIGRDPDYIYPPEADRSQAKRLLFRCYSCNAWVKTVPLPFPVYDRYLVCLCHSVAIRRDTSPPTNYRQWKELLVQAKTETVRHRARQGAD
jgi:hypothetical protein